MIADPRAPYDIPALFKAGQGLGRFVEPLWFDKDENELNPRSPNDSHKAYDFTDFSTVCIIGRPSLLKNCPLVYDFASDARQLLLPPTRLFLPEITKDTERFLKSIPDEESIEKFHCVIERDDKCQRETDKHDLELYHDRWIDYALIQRLKVPNQPGTLVVLAGAISLGTLGAIEQALLHRFSSVQFDAPIHQHSNIEILLAVPAALHSEPTDQPTPKIPWRPENYYLKRVYVDGALVFTDGKRGRNAALRAKLRRYLGYMNSRYRYAQSKYLVLLSEQWPALRQVITDGVPSGRGPLGYVEVHPDERCQLFCAYCRGGLREVPNQQKTLAPQLLKKLIQDIHALNPTAFVRFSGTIGDPLMHPNIVDAFETIRELGTLRWGVTTNGLLLNKPKVTELLMAAKYVHVSLDAGNTDTYHRLKHGHRGNFEKVIRNLEALAAQKHSRNSTVEIVVSFLLQKENYGEVAELSKTLRRIRVDTFEVKMQHFHENRHMSEETVRNAYALIRQVQKADDSCDYRVVVVQAEDAAVAKTRSDSHSIDFARCYANILGVNSAVDANGCIQTCCQYFKDKHTHIERTLGVQGTIDEGLPQIWNSEGRINLLKRDPRVSCVNCSPSDEFVNRFVEFLCAAHREDPSFLEWLDEYRNTLSARQTKV